MAELGFGGAIIPEEYVGTDAGFLRSILITEAIS
jgi:alkylation response protein AidB-like acyl-CoA dehydrogenase